MLLYKLLGTAAAISVALIVYALIHSELTESRPVTAPWFAAVGMLGFLASAVGALLYHLWSL